MFVIGLLLILHSVTHQSEAQVITLGGCPDIRAKTEFDFYRYEGLWYEQERYLYLPQNIGICVAVRYKNFRPENASFEGVMLEVGALTGKKIVTSFTGRLNGPQDRSANFNSHWIFSNPLSPVAVTIDYPYSCLDTDYSTYTIEYHCKQIGIHNLQSLWILTRTRTIPQETRELVYEKLRELGLRPEILKPSRLIDCPDPE